jgi:hypothetical protein
MTTNFTRTLMLAAALGVAGIASAQTMLKADIPFAFRVGEKTMAPGTYLVSNVAGATDALYKLYNRDEKEGVVVMSAGRHDVARAWKNDELPRLAFACGETRCSLVEIWNGHSRESATFRPAKAHGENIRTAVVTARPVKAD